MSRRLLALSTALFAAGIALLALSVLRGEGAAGVALFVPFFYGTGPLASLAVLIFFSGVLCLLAGFFRGLAGAGEEGGGRGERIQPEGGTGDGTGGGAPVTAGDVYRALWRGDEGEWSGGGGASRGARPDAAEARARGGAVVLIGPVPIVCGSDAGIARWMLLLAIVLMAALLAAMVLLAIL